jgi:cytochrome c551/c552
MAQGYSGANQSEEKLQKKFRDGSVLSAKLVPRKENLLTKEKELGLLRYL